MDFRGSRRRHPRPPISLSPLRPRERNSSNYLFLPFLSRIGGCHRDIYFLLSLYRERLRQNFAPFSKRRRRETRDRINRLSRREGVAVRRTAFNLRDDNRWPDKWENSVGAVVRPSFPFWNRARKPPHPSKRTREASIEPNDTVINVRVAVSAEFRLYPSTRARGT